MKCSIYEYRPEICRTYPIYAFQMKIYPSCSYVFEYDELDPIKGNIRSGKCNQCGECCYLNKDIHGLGDKFVKGAPCPYLEP